MATNEDLNTTGGVPDAQSPQTSPSATTNTNTVQKTENPNTANPNESLNVQRTGAPVTGIKALTSNSTGTFVLATIAAVIVIGIVLLIVRIKNFSTLGTGASLGSEADIPRKAKPASSVRPSAKSGTATAAKSSAAKKKSGKAKPTRKKRH